MAMYSNLIGQYMDQESDRAPPLPPRPEPRLQELWKNYRASVEDKVSAKLGSPSAPNSIGSPVRLQTKAQMTHTSSPASSASIREQVAALRRGQNYEESRLLNSSPPTSINNHPTHKEGHIIVWTKTK